MNLIRCPILFFISSNHNELISEYFGKPSEHDNQLIFLQNQVTCGGERGGWNK